MTDIIPVSDRAREAAADAMKATFITPRVIEARVRAGQTDENPLVQAFARFEASLSTDMPVIWEDPAGKGYPCFSRPMTPTEARETLDRRAAQIIDLSTDKERLIEALREARLQLEYVDGRLPTGTTPAVIARIDAALQDHQS
jgi:hypothetical protein